MSDSTYQKAYEREKNARLTAEKLLDEKTREVQSSIDMIQHQFSDLMSQKKESDYLLAVARLTQNQKGIDSIVGEFVQATLDYLGVTVGRYTFVKEKSLVHGPVMGTDIDIPKHSNDLYRELYSLNARKLIFTKDLNNDNLFESMTALKVNRVGFVPIRCFGKVATVCEFYFPEDVDFKSEILDQCEISAYQISSILEGNINKRKLESSYQEIKASHEKLKQAQSQLVQSEKMASLGQLAAGVAHEINNPIGFVMSNVGTLKDYSEVLAEYIEKSMEVVSQVEGPKAAAVKAIDDDQDLKFIVSDISEIMDDCADGLKRVKEIVANLKSFARSDDEEMAEIDINECIENTIKVVWNELKYKVTLHREFQQDLPKIKAHEGQIGQVIMNMLVNASHAIDERGDIHIYTLTTETGIQIQIQDSGKGMSQAVMSKIFDPFFTTKGVSEGTGLGLSISYGIIESHGGTIRVESKEGVGTTFKIELPFES